MAQTHVAGPFDTWATSGLVFGVPFRFLGLIATIVSSAGGNADSLETGDGLS